MGDQLTSWLHSRHAKAYASLSRPEAKQIAKWSGIPMEPQESAMCLGCHATASEAEPWERDDAFSIREGVQCEMCHGPGSEYMDADVMMNREAAMCAGLKMPTKEYCLNCHAEKGSHRIVLGPRTFDLDKAWQEIAHPTPKDWKLTKLQPPPPTGAPPSGPGAYGRRRLCPMPLRRGLGIPVQQVAGEQACGCLCQFGHRQGPRDGRPGGHHRRPADQRAMSEVPRHRVPSTGVRRPGNVCLARRCQLRSVPWRRQWTRRRGGHEGKDRNR